MRIISTNPYETCSCSVSSFQVPEISNDNFQLHYLSDERHFHMVSIGKVEDENVPQEFKGKRGEEMLTIESRPPGLKIVEILFSDLISKRSLYFGLINCYSLNVVDFCSNQQTKGLILRDDGFSRKAIKFFICDNFVHQLTLCGKSMNLCKYELMNVKSFNCLSLCMQKSHWFNVFGLMKFLLHFGMNTQNQVFKPGIYFGSFYGKVKLHQFCVNNFYCFDNWVLNKELRYEKFDFNLNSFLNPFLWLYLKFAFHFVKVNSATEIRLDYISEERRFMMIDKGKNDPCFSIPRGKQGMIYDNFKISLPYSVGNKIFVEELVVARNLNCDVFNCSALFKNDLCFTTFKGKAHELFETSLFSLGGAKDCFVDLIRYSHIGYDLWKRFETFDCLRTCSFSFRIIDEALMSKLVCLHGCEHVALHLSTPMGFSCSILLAFGLQIYLKPFLLTHGYSFQLSQFQSIPFDRGKLSKSCCD